MPETNFDSLIRQLEQLDPNNPDAQWQAAIKLGELGDSRAVEPLIKALKRDNQALVRALAAQAFWKLIDNRAIEPLIASLKDPYYLVRSYSARALGKLKDVDVEKKSVQPLIEVLQNDEFFGARAEAAEALGMICKNDKSEVCKKAREALEKHDETVERDKDERRWRAKREVELALKDIQEAMKKLENLESKTSKPGFSWKPECTKAFNNMVNQLRHGINQLDSESTRATFGVRIG